MKKKPQFPYPEFPKWSKSLKGKNVAKKKAANKKSGKTVAKKIPSGKYLLVPSTDESETIQRFMLESSEEGMIKEAKSMLEESGSEHTILIYKLVKKVSTSQETKVEDIN